MVLRASTPWHEPWRLMVRNIEISDARKFVRGYHYLRADFHRSALFFAVAPKKCKKKTGFLAAVRVLKKNRDSLI
jgi:hypothetical protein